MCYLLDNIHSRIERRPDVLESVLWDAEGQKLSGLALVGFVFSEVKSRILAYGVEMTRTEAFDKAWRLGIKVDFSLYDEIVHTDYESINQGVAINRDVSKAVLAA